MTQPTSRITEAQTESSNKARVEAELRGLQDKHRLAIHVWEGTEDSANIPPDLHLSAEDAAAGRVGGTDMLSLSLLPAQHTGYSMLPWGVENCNFKPRMAYLFSLDQEEAHPATVFRASQRNLYTSPHPHTQYKDLMLHEETYYPPLDALYERFPSQVDLIEYLQAGNCRSFSSRQLDILAHFYDPQSHALKEHRKLQHFEIHPDQVCEHNEVIAGVAKEHLRAIAVPFYETYDHPTRAEVELLGALMGLKHLARGIDLPVVCYHVNKSALQGQCTYLGQGQEELTRLALRAIGQMQAENTIDSDDLKEGLYHPLVSRLLHLDMNRPLASQHAQIEQLMQQAHSASVGRIP